ncbi:oxidoreductase [Paenibacillus pectinilyticus]|uniref:Oxidoreductase n=1 Tax=Paenibacillus pectinilyticus TaxID=512399 RepID=A0A1C1A1S7_9BACL|nr:Gfo/Idh/MocA family oxidoreductase [Paenibacillus pectinilyticus]OCT14481.1 oxidoreductase [Paenibacillus pectinilyticus]
MNNSLLRIGIIGTDSSHAPTFTQLLHDKEHPYHVAGGKVTVAYPGGSPDFDMSYTRIAGFTEQLRDYYGVKIVESAEEVAAHCDAILLTSVDGRLHLEQFRRIAAYRKPIFIDKPMTVSSESARDVISLARWHNIPLMSCSSLRYAEELTLALQETEMGSVIGMDCYGPMALQPTQPGLFWYGVHTAEMLFKSLGKDCLKVTATTTDDHDVITGVWANGTIGTIRGNRKGNTQFGALLHRESDTQFIDVYKHPKPYYASLLEKIMTMFSTGIPDIDENETLQIIRFMEAANESRETGQTVYLPH